MATEQQQQQHPTRVYKILTQQEWDAWQASGTFSGAGIDIKDGYIHLSTDKQVVETYEKFFSGATGIVLVVVDLNKVTDDIRWEASRHGQLFPHVYGSININAAISHVDNWTGQTPQDA